MCDRDDEWRRIGEAVTDYREGCKRELKEAREEVARLRAELTRLGDVIEQGDLRMMDQDAELRTAQDRIAALEATIRHVLEEDAHLNAWSALSHLRQVLDGQEADDRPDDAKSAATWSDNMHPDRFQT